VEPPAEPSKEEQEAAFNECRMLCETDHAINEAFHAVATARYVHQTAKNRMLELVRAKAKEKLTELMITSASMFESEHNQITLQQVRDRHVNILTPFLLKLIGTCEEEEKQARHADIMQAEEQRRKRPLAIGDLTLDRNRSIIVPVYWLPSVSVLIEQLLLSLPDDHNMRIVRLTNFKSHPDAAKRCVEVPAKIFDGMAQSADRFRHAITSLVQERLRQPSVDIVIIDDLLKLGQPSIFGMDPVRHAAAMHKNMRNGLREVGAVLIAGFQTDLSPSTDPKDSTWGPLAQFTRILAMDVRDPVEGIRRIEWGPLTFRVDEETWDKARGLGLIVP
jgi:hypothetical protein